MSFFAAAITSVRWPWGTQVGSWSSTAQTIESGISFVTRWYGV